MGSDRSYTETVAFCIEQSDGVTTVSESLKGDTVREVLDYVQFKSDSLVARLRRSVEAAVREGHVGAVMGAYNSVDPWGEFAQKQSWNHAQV